MVEGPIFLKYRAYRLPWWYKGVVQTMALMTYIRKHPKTGVYEYRRVVPEALRAGVGKREIRRTLGTRDANEAKRLGHEVAAEVDRLLQEAEADAPALGTPSENTALPIVKRPTRA